MEFMTNNKGGIGSAMKDLCTLRNVFREDRLDGSVRRVRLMAVMLALLPPWRKKTLMR